MPIYEYRCNECGHKLESLQKLADAPLVTCPACGRNALSKLVSAAGFQLKGSGWYATDFKGSGSKPAEKTASESGSESKSSDAAATTSPAKSETASETKAAPAAAATTPATGSGSSSA